MAEKEGANVNKEYKVKIIKNRGSSKREREHSHTHKDITSRLVREKMERTRRDGACRHSGFRYPSGGCILF